MALNRECSSREKTKLNRCCYSCTAGPEQKIYLMAHSGGTFIGIQAAARAPELFHANLAMAQIYNQHGCNFESECF